MARTNDFVSNRDSLIAQALRIVGAIRQGDTPDANKISESAEALNQLITTLNANGGRTWKTTADNVSILAAASEVNLDTDTSSVANVKIKNLTESTTTPITLITQKEYDAIPDNTETGRPSVAWYDWYNCRLYIYPVADQAYTVYFRKTQRLYDFDVSTDTPDFPVEWEEVLKFGLAHRLSFEYQLPLDERESIFREFNKALNVVSRLDMDIVEEDFTSPAY
jgi:hypothetical protein